MIDTEDTIASKKTGILKKPKGPKFYFWATILTLAIGTALLVVFGSVRNYSNIPSEYEISPTTLETIFSNTAEVARLAVEPDVGAVLLSVYAPVYAAIPIYAEFHYSVLGEYTELTEAALGQMSGAIEERLFAGFGTRLNGAAQTLDQRFVEEYQNALRDNIQAKIPAEKLTLPLGQMSQSVLDDALSRATVTFPIAGVSAGVVGSGGLKVISALIAKKMAAKIATKAAIKGVAKGGSVLVGAGGGALLCSWSGPFAALCGIAGGTAAWLLTDAAIINIDEYYNRADFEADLRIMIDDDRLAKEVMIEAALVRKASAMDEASNSILEEFTLRDLSD